MLSRLAHARTDFAGALRTDALASVVVFLVALPLCMGIAIASGAPPAAGLITGIVGGLVVGVLAGSPLQVSGPAAGLAVIVWELLQQHGAAGLGVIVLLAGLAQLENLRTHPAVAAKLASGELQLHGWVYKIETGEVFGYDAASGQFVPIAAAAAPAVERRRPAVSI